jgi:hypothetical protein
LLWNTVHKTSFTLFFGLISWPYFLALFFGLIPSNFLALFVQFLFSLHLSRPNFYLKFFLQICKLKTLHLSFLVVQSCSTVLENCRSSFCYNNFFVCNPLSDSVLDYHFTSNLDGEPKF